MTWYNVNLHQTINKIFHVRYKACLSELLVDAEVICACMCRCHLRASVEVTRVNELSVLTRKGQLHVRAEVNLVNAPGSHLRKYTHADVICMCTLKSIVYAHRSHLGVHTEIKRAGTPMITRTRPIRTPVHLHVHIISINELPTSLVGQQL